MKKIKLSFVALAILALGTFVFTSCSDDGSTETPDNSMSNYRITNENAFIDEFYSTSWRTGVSASVRDSLNTYVVTEIIVGSDTKARGYLVKDYNTGDLLYFADVDRIGYVMKTVDLITEEWETITDIDRHPDYSLTDGFDIIKIIDDGNYGYVTYGYYTYGACAPNNVGGGCSAGVYYQKTFLGFKWGKETAVLTPHGNNAYTPCNCSTGEVTPY